MHVSWIILNPFILKFQSILLSWFFYLSLLFFWRIEIDFFLQCLHLNSVLYYYCYDQKCTHRIYKVVSTIPVNYFGQHVHKPNKANAFYCSAFGTLRYVWECEKNVIELNVLRKHTHKKKKKKYKKKITLNIRKFQVIRIQVLFSEFMIIEILSDSDNAG